MTTAKKQTELPGIEKPTIKELDVLLEEYAVKAADLSRLRVEIGQLKEKILETAEKHKVTTYRDETAVPPLVLVISPGATKVKVKPSGMHVEMDDDVEAEDDAA